MKLGRLAWALASVYSACDALDLAQRQRVVVRPEDGVTDIETLTSQASAELEVLVIDDPGVGGTFTGTAQWPNLRRLRILRSGLEGDIPCPPFNTDVLDYQVRSDRPLRLKAVCDVPAYCDKRMVFAHESSGIRGTLPPWMLSNWCVSYVYLEGNELSDIGHPPVSDHRANHNKQSIYLRGNSFADRLDNVLCEARFSWDIERAYQPCALTMTEVFIIVAGVVALVLCIGACASGVGLYYYRKFLVSVSPQAGSLFPPSGFNRVLEKL